jgi:hypothetical protein
MLGEFVIVGSNFSVLCSVWWVTLSKSFVFMCVRMFVYIQWADLKAKICECRDLPT